MDYFRRPDRLGRLAAALAHAAPVRAVGAAFAILLGAVALGDAAGGSEWFFAWRIAALFLLFTGGLMIGRHVLSGDVDPVRAPTVLVLLIGVYVGVGGAIVVGRSGGPDWSLVGRIGGLFLLGVGLLMMVQSTLGEESNTHGSDAGRLPILFTLRLTLLVGLLVLTYQSSNPGIGLGAHRVGELTLLFVTLMAFCVFAGDPQRYSPAQWFVIACFAAVVGLFYYHTLSESAGGLPVRRQVWSSVLMGVGLIVLPQYVSKDAFLWALSRLAAILVVISLPIYVIGEYSVFGLQVGFHNGYTVPLVGYRVAATRSVFVNRNTFAIVVFAGVVTAAAEVHRSIASERSVRSVVVPAIVVAITGTGLAFAYGRALWVLTPMALGIYIASQLDRRLLPIAVVGAGVYVVGGIAAVHTGALWLPADTPTRASRWYPAIAVLIDNPSLFGEGLVVPGEYIGENRADWRGGSSHNSYVSIFIRIGIVGGLAYVGMAAASIVRGMWNYRSVDAALLALAVAFATHQLFEAYTMFRWRIGSVIATLAIGFLAFGWSKEDAPSVTPHGGENPDDH